MRYQTLFLTIKFSVFVADAKHSMRLLGEQSDAVALLHGREEKACDVGAHTRTATELSAWRGKTYCLATSTLSQVYVKKL